jgi:hypothetical protein
MGGSDHKLKSQLTHRNNLQVAPCSQGPPYCFPGSVQAVLRGSSPEGEKLATGSGYAATSTGTSAGGPSPWAVFSQNDGVTTSCHPALTAAMDIMTQ